MSDESSAGEPGPVARTLYGRRKGKKLRLHQSELLASVLPTLAIEVSTTIEHPAALFAFAPQAVRIEIGFGGAEHLVHEASRHPQIGYIGCEPFVNGVAKLLAQIEDRQIANVRAHHGDAREILVKLSDGSIDRIDVLYPDPWPKARHAERRMVNPQYLAAMHAALAPDGELFVASDHPVYQPWVDQVMAESPHFALLERTGTRPLGRIETRYEAKARREGRTPVYWTFRRR